MHIIGALILYTIVVAWIEATPPEDPEIIKARKIYGTI